VEKRILFILTGLVSGASIGLLVYYNLTGLFPPALPFTLLVFGSGILGLGLQFILFKVSSTINKRVSWQNRFAFRFGLEVVLNGGLAILIGSLALLAILIAVTGKAFAEVWQGYWESFAFLWILTMVFILVYTIIMLLFYAQFHYAEGQIDDLKTERKQLKLQFEALKSQLSPHYLFNSLNTVSSLLYEDKEAAEEFIRRLAETYQYILSTHKKQLVTLEEELSFVQAYYFLLCVRYKEGLRLQVNIPEHLKSQKIPPMTLQILVENAIKHNIFSLDQPLNIELVAEDDKTIRVINNKTEQPISVKSNKIGLNNIKHRYRYFTSNKIKVVDEQKFAVAVPIINKPNSQEAA
jgi:sensor histidine kinase YesM